MGQNEGLIFGRITEDGGAISGNSARVEVNWIKGNLSQPELRVTQKEGQTHSRAFVDLPKDTGGKYVLPFNWSGTQIATTLQGALTASLLGMVYRSDGDYRAKNIRVRAFLCLNLKALISQGYPTFDSPTEETLDVARDFIIAYREILPKYQTFVPHYKIFLSTEVQSILARADIDISSA